MANMAGVTRIKIRRGLNIVKRSDVWHLSGFQNGQQIRGTLDTADPVEAQRRALERMSTPVQVAAVFKALAKPDALTLDKAMEEYETWYDSKRKPSTGKVSLPIVRNFIKAV